MQWKREYRQMVKKDLLDIVFRWIVIIFSACIIFMNALTNYSGDMILTCILILFISIYIIYIYRNNFGILLAMLFILYSNYSIVMGVYIDPNIRLDDLYDQITEQSVYGAAITTILVFEITMLIFSIWNNKYAVNHEIIDNSKSRDELSNTDRLITVCCMAVYSIIFITQFKPGENGARATGSPLLEYRCIFMIIGLIYSRGDKKIRNIWFVILTVTSLMIFIGGNRAEALSPVIAFAVYYIKKINPIKLLILMSAAVIAMICIGEFRANFDLSIESIFKVIDKIQRDKLTFDTATCAYFPALGSVYISNGINADDKARILLYNFIYIFAGGEYGNIRIQFIVKQFFHHLNGFVSPLYFYIWVNIFSGSAFAAIVNGYMRIGLKRAKLYMSDYKYGIFIYFCAMTPRWYLYDPFPLIRGMFVYSVFYFIIRAGYNILKRSFSNC